MPASDDTVHRLLDLYRHADSKLASALEDNANLSAVEPANTMAQKRGIANPGQVRAYFSEAAGTAAKFLAQPDGPRVGALALDGWDTHFNEGIAQGRLSQLLAALDAALAAVKSNMGTGWRETVVALATEFGRTGICRNLLMPKAAIRVSLPSFCAAPSTALPPWHLSAIPTG